MPQQIVIIGAGSAGIKCAQTLARSLRPTDDTQVLVLEKQAHLYHAIATPRAYVDASIQPRLFIPYDNAFPKTASGFMKLQRAIATRINLDTNEVTYHVIGSDDAEVDKDELIKFDYLVIATGSTYTIPIKPDPKNFKRDAIEAQLNEVRAKIEGAEKILIVGGGAVGCEVAGDIASKYPSKSVTLLEGRDRLVAGNNVRDKFRDRLTESLRKLKVNVILGERLEERLAGNCFEKRTLRTDKGTSIESDIQLLCGGFRPVTELIAQCKPDLVADNGLIKVNAQMQLDDPALHHVFVLGDASNNATPKLGYWAGEQGKFLANELVAKVRGTISSFTKPYPVPTVEAMLLPLGPNGGVSQLPVMGGCVVGDMMTRMIKSKDMFTGKAWGDMNAPLPH